MKGTLKIKDEITGMVIGVIENYEARITPDEWLAGYLINGDVRHWLQNKVYNLEQENSYLRLKADGKVTTLQSWAAVR